MSIIRLRAEVADEPGALCRLSCAIARCGGSILGIDVHYLDGARVADELTVEFLRGDPAALLASAVLGAGGVVVEIQEVDEHAVVDPIARSLDVASKLLVGSGRLEDGAAELVGADGARLVEEAEDDGSSLLQQAAREQSPVFGRAEDGREVLAIPDVDGPRRRVMVIERDAPAFSASEAARVAALLRLAHAAAGDARSRASSALAAVGPATPVQRRPAAFFRRSNCRSA